MGQIIWLVRRKEVPGPVGEQIYACFKGRGGIRRDYQKSRNHVFACLQMMPEIRVALFGANPNRKFMDWGAPACERGTLLVFYFLFSNVVIPPPVNILKTDELLLWCIIGNFLCIAGRDRSCCLTLHQQLELLVYITVSFFIQLDSLHLQH